MLNNKRFVKFTITLIACLHAVPGLAQKEKSPDDEKPETEYYSTLKDPWRNNMIARWEAEISQAEAEIDSLAKQIRRANPATRQSIGTRIRSQKQKLKELKKNDPPYIPQLRVAHIQNGAFGHPRMIDAKVMQVIDENQMLVGIEDAQHGGDRYSNWILVKCPTAGIVDGKFWRDWDFLIGDDLMVVTGTTTYRTAAGSTKTVFVLESVSIDSMKKEAAILGKDDATTEGKKSGIEIPPKPAGG